MCFNRVHLLGALPLERQAAGILIVGAQGRCSGRKVTEKERGTGVLLLDAEGMSKKISEMLGISRTSVYRTFNEDKKETK